ncbi:c-type cytochrome [Myxococcota bacterium]|nr:c-type cytochrome [Myxococcota bacterium]
MARYQDQLLDFEADGIRKYDNPPPSWLMWILYGSIVFSVLYMAFYALSFGPGMDAEYQEELVRERALVQKYYADNPLVPPTADQLLAGALDPDVLSEAHARFQKSCASCHGEQAQGLIGPNLTDGQWLHGGKVTDIFQTIAAGVPAKGMPPWGRSLRPEELSALVSYIRSLHGTEPANAKPAEGAAVDPEPLPVKKGEPT